MSALEQACKAFGGSNKLASALGREKASISRWKKERVPAEFCPDIERLTGVRCEELRPDVNWSVLRKAPRLAKTA
jgi:DNA-binding transcriptional regulator YdaS (Cro superfamily)